MERRKSNKGGEGGGWAEQSGTLVAEKTRKQKEAKVKEAKAEEAQAVQKGKKPFYLKKCTAPIYTYPHISVSIVVLS